jgi:hypothetical protein
MRRSVRECAAGSVVAGSALLALILCSGCGTALPKVSTQPVVEALPAADSGVLAEMAEKAEQKLGAGVSGFHLVSRNAEALQWRRAMVHHATRAVDAKYFIWQGDAAGKLLMQETGAAADRGVRVRLLVDDLTVTARDRDIAAMCLHPNVDVNPSESLGEATCVVGVCRDRRFVRLYPVPFRRLEDEKQFSKYQVIRLQAQEPRTDSRARSGHAPENLAALRRLALNTIKADNSQTKLSVRSKRPMAAWNQDYLANLIGAI